VGEDEAAEDGGHEGVGAALFEKAVDPELKAAVKSELCAEDFILAEDQEKDANADTENGQGSGVDVCVRISGSERFRHGALA
jgi:hypothetical protein